MNTHSTTPDLLSALGALKQADQLDLLEYIQKRYSLTTKITKRYRKNALSQIRKALK